MHYLQTQRLILRDLTRTDLPRLATIINDWDIVRWLAVVPFPYKLADAEAFYAEMSEAAQASKPEAFAIAEKGTNNLIGIVGFHPGREGEPREDALMLGYWLSKDKWGKGILSEAVAALLPHIFATRPDIHLIYATTDPDNQASQNVLRKAGLTYTGDVPRQNGRENQMLSQTVTRWEITRAGFKERISA